MEYLGNISILRQLSPCLEDLEKGVSNFVGKKIKEHFLSYFLYELKLEKLEEYVEKLQKTRDRMQCWVDDEYQNGKDTAKDALKWFQQVDNIIDEINEFWQDKLLPYTICSKGYLPKPRMRFSLAKEAYRLAREVDDLCKTSFLDGVSSGIRPISMDFLLSVDNFESFNLRKQLTEDITKVLKYTTIKMVGVHGMGGVGKTTLVKEVTRKAQKDKLFDVVIFATVTRNPAIKQIQGQLDDQLGARLNEETDIGRASRLRDIFKKEKKNILVVLDDLWAELDLTKLGIDDINLSPNFAKDTTKNQMSKEGGTSSDGQAKKEGTGNSIMLKILLHKEVVCDKMNVKENSIFLIKGLEGREALFKKMVGIVDKSFEFGSLATIISVWWVTYSNCHNWKDTMNRELLTVERDTLST